MPAAEPQMGPATIAPHWSKYEYPESVPEGTPYHLIVRGDTLWDLAEEYLGTPYLWPQIWESNSYITDAHWIYPGDPLVLPSLALIAGSAGQPDPEGTQYEIESQFTTQTDEGTRLFPVTEEVTMFCAGRIAPTPDDESFILVGSEYGSDKHTFSDRDIVYINRGSAAGVAPGDVFVAHRTTYKVRHPDTNDRMGQKIVTTGRVRVLIVAENSSTTVVEQACEDMDVGDYLLPYERPTVPLAEASPVPDPFTPPSGKAQGYIVDLDADLSMAATGHLVAIDLGADSGLAPGNRLLAFRDVHEGISSRRILGELAVLVVRDATSVAKIMYSVDTLLNGDRVEIR